MDVSENGGTPKSSIGVFHYKSSILGYPLFLGENVLFLETSVYTMGHTCWVLKILPPGRTFFSIHEDVSSAASLSHTCFFWPLLRCPEKRCGESYPNATWM